MERPSLPFPFASRLFSQFLNNWSRCVLSGEYRPLVPSVSRAAPRDPISDELFSLIPRTSLDAQQRLLQIRLRLDQLPPLLLPSSADVETHPDRTRSPLLRLKFGRLSRANRPPWSTASRFGAASVRLLPDLDNYGQSPGWRRIGVCMADASNRYFERPSRLYQLLGEL